MTSKYKSFRMGATVNGLTFMNHKVNLSNYAEELVANYAAFRDDCCELALDEIPPSSQGELARLYIEATHREVGECIYGDDFSINNEFTCALLAMLQDDSEENQVHFAEVTRRNVLIYYRESLQELLDTTCHYFFQNMKNEQGLYAHYNDEHGDIEWRG